jgi:hypothetical protein
VITHVPARLPRQDLVHRAPFQTLDSSSYNLINSSKSKLSDHCARDMRLVAWRAKHSAGANWAPPRRSETKAAVFGRPCPGYLHFRAGDESIFWLVPVRISRLGRLLRRHSTLRSVNARSMGGHLNGDALTVGTNLFYFSALTSSRDRCLPFFAPCDLIVKKGTRRSARPAPVTATKKVD